MKAVIARLMARGRSDKSHWSDAEKAAFCEAFAVHDVLTRACEEAATALGLAKPIPKTTALQWLKQPRWKSEVERLRAIVSRAREASFAERLPRVQAKVLEGLEKAADAGITALTQPDLEPHATASLLRAFGRTSADMGRISDAAAGQAGVAAASPWRVQFFEKPLPGAESTSRADAVAPPRDGAAPRARLRRRA